LGYQIALVKTPYYYKPAYNGAVYLRHYRSVADASPIPILLYSVPVFTGITLETPEIVELAKHPNIIGIKDSTGVIQRIVEVVPQAPADFRVLTRSAPVLYPALASGAKGAVLALASALPERCVELFELFRMANTRRRRNFSSVWHSHRKPSFLRVVLQDEIRHGSARLPWRFAEVATAPSSRRENSPLRNWSTRWNLPLLANPSRPCCSPGVDLSVYLRVTEAGGYHLKSMHCRALPSRHSPTSRLTARLPVPMKKSAFYQHQSLKVSPAPRAVETPFRRIVVAR
jgi:hypothetical protein